MIMLELIRGGSRAAATSKMERFVIIANGQKPLTIITKHYILDVVAALDPPLFNAEEKCEDQHGGYGYRVRNKEGEKDSEILCGYIQDQGVHSSRSPQVTQSLMSLVQ